MFFVGESQATSQLFCFLRLPDKGSFLLDSRRFWFQSSRVQQGAVLGFHFRGGSIMKTHEKLNPVAVFVGWGLVVLSLTLIPVSIVLSL